MSTLDDITIEQDITVMYEAVEALRDSCTDPKHLDLILAHLSDIEADVETITAELDEAHHRTLEERGLMVCPICNGTSDSPYDITTLSLEPPDVCGGCDGHRYINPARFVRHIVTHTDDVWGAFTAAALNEDEQGWL